MGIDRIERGLIGLSDGLKWVEGGDVEDVWGAFQTPSFCMWADEAAVCR